MWQNGSWRAQPEVGGYTASCVGFFKFAGYTRLGLTLSAASNLKHSMTENSQRTLHRSLAWSPGSPRDSVLVTELGLDQSYCSPVCIALYSGDGMVATRPHGLVGCPLCGSPHL